MMTGEDYVIIHGPLAGIGPSMYESVPFSEAQPSVACAVSQAKLPASLTWPKNYYRSWLISIGCRSYIRDDSDVAARARGDADYPTSLSRYSR